MGIVSCSPELQRRELTGGQTPIAEGFRNMGCLNRLALRQVGQGTCHAQNAVIAARLPPRYRCAKPGYWHDAGRDSVRPGWCGRRQPAQPPRCYLHVATQAQVADPDRANFTDAVDTVKQRAGNPALKFMVAFWRAAATLRRVDYVTAAAGFYGSDQLESRRVSEMTIGSGDDDAVGFDRLEQRFQCRAQEFW